MSWDPLLTYDLTMSWDPLLPWATFTTIGSIINLGYSHTMESLALVVVILLAITISSGPLALFLSWLPAINREGTSGIVRLIRRIFITFFSLLGSLISFNLFLSGSAASLIGLFGSVTAIIAIQREYFPGGLKTIFGKENGNRKKGSSFFKGKLDPRNGPDGQH
jgi:hypothetical protein